MSFQLLSWFNFYGKADSAILSNYIQRCLAWNHKYASYRKCCTASFIACLLLLERTETLDFPPLQKVFFEQKLSKKNTSVPSGSFAIVPWKTKFVQDNTDFYRSISIPSARGMWRKDLPQDDECVPGRRWITGTRLQLQRKDNKQEKHTIADGCWRLKSCSWESREAVTKKKPKVWYYWCSDLIKTAQQEQMNQQQQQ